MFQNVAEVVDRCLRPPEPIVIFHEIRIDPEEPTKTRAFNIEVDIDDSMLKTKIRDVLTRLVPTVESKVSQIDEEVIVIFLGPRLFYSRFRFRSLKTCRRYVAPA